MKWIATGKNGENFRQALPSCQLKKWCLWLVLPLRKPLNIFLDVLGAFHVGQKALSFNFSTIFTQKPTKTTAVLHTFCNALCVSRPIKDS